MQDCYEFRKISSVMLDASKISTSSRERNFQKMTRVSDPHINALTC